jgi:hypothetical protein
MTLFFFRLGLGISLYLTIFLPEYLSEMNGSEMLGGCKVKGSGGAASSSTSFDIAGNTGFESWPL